MLRKFTNPLSLLDFMRFHDPTVRPDPAPLNPDRSATEVQQKTAFSPGGGARSRQHAAPALTGRGQIRAAVADGKAAAAADVDVEEVRDDGCQTSSVCRPDDIVHPFLRPVEIHRLTDIPLGTLADWCRSTPDLYHLSSINAPPRTHRCVE